MKQLQIYSCRIVMECEVRIGNTVNTIGITMSGTRWVLEILGGTLCKVYD